MRVLLTPSAARKIIYAQENQSYINGFLLGKRISRFIIINDIVSSSITFENCIELCSDAYQIFGDRIKGFFLKKGTFFTHEYFMEKLILEIDVGKIDFFIERIITGPGGMTEKIRLKHIFAENVKLL